jgi:putative ABC transport system substrate-binding protein
MNKNKYLCVSAARRRLLVAGAALPALAWTCTARAQTKPPVVIGWLNLGAREPNSYMSNGFREGMAALGWTVGVHYVLEERWGEGRRERMQAYAQELAAKKPAVIVAHPGSSARMAAKAAPATPIVHLGSDALAIGLVKSLARPGGMITGLTNVNAELSAKLIELLVESVPKLRRIGFFADAAGPSYGTYVNVVHHAAKRYRFEASIADVMKPEDIEPAAARLARDKVQALVLFPTTLLAGERQKIATLALARRWPLVSSSPAFPYAGALFSYGPDYAETYRRAAYFVDRILKGAKPGDLPIEQPTKYEMVLNLKTAKALGITIPQSILVRANKVIE